MLPKPAISLGGIRKTTWFFKVSPSGQVVPMIKGKKKRPERAACLLLCRHTCKGPVMLTPYSLWIIWVVIRLHNPAAFCWVVSLLYLSLFLSLMIASCKLFFGGVVVPIQIWRFLRLVWVGSTSWLGKILESACFKGGVLFGFYFKYFNLVLSFIYILAAVLYDLYLLWNDC